MLDTLDSAMSLYDYDESYFFSKNSRMGHSFRGSYGISIEIPLRLQYQMPLEQEEIRRGSEQTPHEFHTAGRLHLFRKRHNSEKSCHQGRKAAENEHAGNERNRLHNALLQAQAKGFHFL